MDLYPRVGSKREKIVQAALIGLAGLSLLACALLLVTTGIHPSNFEQELFRVGTLIFTFLIMCWIGLLVTRPFRLEAQWWRRIETTHALDTGIAWEPTFAALSPGDRERFSVLFRDGSPLISMTIPQMVWDWCVGLVREKNSLRKTIVLHASRRYLREYETVLLLETMGWADITRTIVPEGNHRVWQYEVNLTPKFFTVLREAFPFPEKWDGKGDPLQVT